MMTIEQQQKIQRRVLSCAENLTREELLDNLVWLTIAYKMHTRLLKRLANEAFNTSRHVETILGELDEASEEEYYFRGKNYVANVY